MALFGKKKGEVKSETKSDVGMPVLQTIGERRDISTILKHARITEKASMHQEQGVYTFDIARSASKRDVMQAVRSLYKVTPRMVRVVTIPVKSRRNARTGKLGNTGGGKKAYVYLKKGETITF